MIAIVQTGGKQYIVKEQDQLRVEKLVGKAGDSISLDQVLLVADDTGDKVTVGMPLVSSAKISGSIVEHGRAKKVRLTKFKNKIRYRRTAGHRQAFTKIKIEKIST